MSTSDPAETYESFMVPAMFEPLAIELLDFAAPRSGERVLDLACGTGIVARKLAAQPGEHVEIVGLDFNPQMLAVARATAARDGLAVEWREGDACALPFPDGSFDLVVCQMAIQFLPDRPKAIAEAYRVLAAGGRIALNTWYGLDQNPFWRALDAATGRHLGSGMVAQPFCLGDPAEVTTLLSDAGFGQIEVEPVTIIVRHRSPEQFLTLQIRGSAAVVAAVRTLDARQHAELADAIRVDMAGPLSEHTRDGRLEISTAGYTVIAHRPS